MGLPTEDAFTLIMIMNPMSEELSSVRDHIADCIAQNTTLIPYTSQLARLCLDIEQQLIDAAKEKSPSSIALVATPATNSRNKMCKNCRCAGHSKCCTNCNGFGHTVDKCFHDGGGHAGQWDVVLAENAAKQGKGTLGLTRVTPTTMAITKGPGAQAGTVCYATNGKAYFINPDTHEAFLLA
ncbi:hypothetical protein PAXRUDRAFT_83666, partial [Paxillus rubicundulus Ve08.2h10]